MHRSFRGNIFHLENETLRNDIQEEKNRIMHLGFPREPIVIYEGCLASEAERMFRCTRNCHATLQ